MFFFISLTFSVEHKLFRSCAKMRFCRDNINASFKYEVDPKSINYNDSFLTGEFLGKNLTFQISSLQSGAIRFRVEPKNSESFRFDVSKEEIVVIQKEINNVKAIKINKADDKATIQISNNIEIIIEYKPLKVFVKQDKKHIMTINSQNNFFFEHHIPKVKNERHHFIYNDPIKNGATAVGVDFEFFGKNVRISGLPERAAPLNLKDTGNDPIRLFNTDAIQYKADNPIHIYGCVPLLMAHSESISAAVFWMNPTDTFVSIESFKDSRKTRFVSEGGYLDFVVFVDDFKGILQSYTQLTGRPALPPRFALGYHQCKWGYMNQPEVEGIMKKLDEVKIPFDVMWLDVDHLKWYAPFVLDEKAFPNILEMAKKMSEKNRYLIRLSDPHFPVFYKHKQHIEARSMGGLMRKANGRTFWNLCWPGLSAWPDLLNPKVRQWYSRQFGFDNDFAAPNIFYWNDMNEPSAFVGDQMTFPKSLIHYNGIESRETHNIYGALNHAATYVGLRSRANNTRPFILTRSFFAGSQKHTWVWTGDNTASWEHLRVSIPMVLSNGLSGIPFIGADVGGFFGHPDGVLLTRWFQLGAWAYTFFREHAVKMSPHREPYLYQKEYLDAMRKAVVERYEMISYWYTESVKASRTGVPVVRPMFAEFNDIQDNQRQVMVGESILVAPVLENSTSAFVEKPTGRWYAFRSGNELTHSGNVYSPLDETPVFIRGGKIIAKHIEVADNVKDTVSKPLEIIVSIDENEMAAGEVYFDDGETYDCLNDQNAFNNVTFNYCDGSLQFHRSSKFDIPKVKRIVFYGLKKIPIKSDIGTLRVNNGICIVEIDSSIEEGSQVHLEFSNEENKIPECKLISPGEIKGNENISFHEL